MRVFLSSIFIILVTSTICYSKTVDTSPSGGVVINQPLSTGHSTRSRQVRELQDIATQNHTHKVDVPDTKDENTQRQAFGAGVGGDIVYVLDKNKSVKSENRYDVVNREFRTFGVFEYRFGPGAK